MPEFLEMMGNATGAQNLLSEKTDLGIEEFHKYRVLLEKARYQIRGDYERARTEDTNLRNELIEKYEKLYEHVKNNNPLFKNANLGEREISGGENVGTQLYSLVGGQNSTMTAEEKAQRLKQYLGFQDLLVQECGGLDKQRIDAEKKVAALNNNLANFLHDQSNSIASVEQAEALNTKLMRSVQRTSAHNAILTALRGYHVRQDGEVEVSLHISENDEDATDIRSIKDNKDTADLKKVEEELLRLQALEEHTDQLVDRLKVKLDSINLLEESQVEMVDFQVRKHGKTLQRLRDIEVTVTQRNQDLFILREQMKAEVLDKLKPPSAGGALTAQSMYSYCLAAVLCLVVAFMALVAVYFFSRLSSF